MARSLFALVLLAFAVTQSQPSHASDTFKSGSNAYTVGMYSSAARHWLDLAQKGHAPAQYNIGRLFYYGKGLRRDRIEAYKWFLISAKNGVQRSVEAMRIAGERMTSRETAEARIRAREWLKQNAG